MLNLVACVAVMAGTYCGQIHAPDPPAPVAQPVSVVAAEVPTVDYASVESYLRSLDARTLIEIAWAGTGQTQRALAIANRESHFSCTAKNPRSSATGVFQTLSIHRPRAERLGFTWAQIAGPDCYADVMLAFDMWKDSGWGPWRT